VRRLMLLIAGASIWLFLFALPVFADNGSLHKAGAFGKTPSACASCHRTHSAAAENLLVNAQPGLCYQCHGSGVIGATTDVQDGSLNGAGTQALRGGGFDYALISSDNFVGSGFSALTIYASGKGATASTPGAGAALTSSHHSTDGAVTAWGNAPLPGFSGSTPTLGTATVLTCGSCHDPHGNHQFRILKPAPTDSGIALNTHSPDQATFDKGGRVYVNDVAYTVAKDYTTANYGVIDPGNQSPTNLAPVDNTGTAAQPTTPFNGSGWNGGPQNNSLLAYNTTKKNWYGDWTNVSSQWCATCHTRYMAPTGSATVDSGDAVFAYRHAIGTLINPAGTNTGGTIGTVANWLTTDGTATAGPSNVGTIDATAAGHGPKCLLCHVSHGSNAFASTTIKNQTSPGIIEPPTGPSDPGGVAGTPHMASTLLRLDNRGVCQACHSK